MRDAGIDARYEWHFCGTGYIQDRAAPSPASMALPLFGERQRYWVALATKDDWRQSSRYEWVTSGLMALADMARQVGVSSIAMPRPGCGNGHLDWSRVADIVTTHLADFDVRVYSRP